MTSLQAALDVLLSFFSTSDSPANVIDPDPFGVGSALCLGLNSTIALVNGADGDNDEQDWIVTTTAGVAINVPDIKGSLDWLNAANRGTSIGRYYCAISNDGSGAAIVHETSIHGQWFDHTAPLSRRRLLSTAFAVLDNASNKTPDVLGDLGGELFDLEWAATTLLVISDPS